MNHLLVPAPLETSEHGGPGTLPGAATSLCYDPQLAGAARLLRQTLGAATGWELPTASGDDADIVLRYVADVADGPATVQHNEGYRLDTTSGRVQIEAPGEPGAYYAVQTLLQLLGEPAFRRAPASEPSWTLPAVTITDAPRCGYRGVMLDVARHFIPKNDLLVMIEALAAHKLNVLHLHLTDDQGWRIEIRRYPGLTRRGAWRSRSARGDWRAGHYDETPHGGFYTQGDLREIVAFAAQRHVTIIPEIDVPGHSQSAIAAYPWLAGLPDDAAPDVWDRWGVNDLVIDPSPETIDFYRNVLDEVLQLFPAPWVGLGGDEVPLTQWEASPAARQRAADLGLPDVGGLHFWFLDALADHLRAHGRRPAFWDEAAEGDLDRGALIHCWREYSRGLEALAKGFDVVMCPERHLYFDYAQSDSPDEPIPVGRVTTLESVYDFDPIPSGLDDALPGRLLGAQGNLWTEHLDSPRRVQYAAFPRLCALAENLWSPAETRDYADFARRLETAHFARLSAMGLEYRPLSGPLPWQKRPGVAGTLHLVEGPAGLVASDLP
ncbi:beta-N-acetylhexosaminidase [Micropruina sp.]|uniref:beta-N-acetylhexosaminidase n=1 Tax=Micropruina sp. TaxID=2737536 RepID=UPI0039E7118D